MAKNFLDMPQTGALLKQVRGKSVPQGVDAAFALYAGRPACVFVNLFYRSLRIG
jgi:hypothetical protein